VDHLTKNIVRERGKKNSERRKKSDKQKKRNVEKEREKNN